MKDNVEEELIKKMCAETLKTNCVAMIAFKDDRDYIAPEDVHDAFKDNSVDKVRKDVLEILADSSGFGVEDRSLTAWVAFEGK